MWHNLSKHILSEWGTYLGQRVPTLAWEVLILAGGTRLTLLGGTYLGWGVPTLARGLPTLAGGLPWLEVPTLARGVPTLAEVVPTLARGYLPWLRYPPSCGRKHTCENITFPILRMRAVKNSPNFALCFHISVPHGPPL